MLRGELLLLGGLGYVQAGSGALPTSLNRARRRRSGAPAGSGGYRERQIQHGAVSCFGLSLEQLVNHIRECHWSYGTTFAAMIG